MSNCTTVSITRLYVAERLIGDFTREELVLMRRAINSTLAGEGADLNPVEETIMDAVCQQFHISRRSLLIRDRRATLAWPRQVAMFLIRERTDKSFDEIGSIFKRDHGTVMHACRTVAQRATCHEERKQIDAIVAKL